MPWPINNRADSLTVDFFYLQRRIGAALQFGRVADEWDDEQEQLVQEIIDEGVRQAYDPPPLMPPYTITPVETHEWSFLRPTHEFSTVASQRRYPLPTNFIAPLAPLTFQTSGQDYHPVQYTIASRLRALEARSESTQSAPEWFALEPTSTTGEGEQGWTLVLHPTPEKVYKLAGQFQAEAHRLDENRPYPPGGNSFGQVLLASCMAAAELQVSGKHGPQYSQFLSKLASAVIRDSKYQADSLGYNGNMTDDAYYGRGTARRLGRIWYNEMTYGGETWHG